MSIAPALSWQTNKIKKSKVYVLTFLTLSLVLLLQSFYTNFNPWGFIGILIGAWIILASLISTVISFKTVFNFQYIKNINAFIAHIGVGILIIGITSSSIFKRESDFMLQKGEHKQLGQITIKLDEIKITEKSNFQSLRGLFTIKLKETKIGRIEAGKNYYHVSKIITTEAGIYHNWFNDIYIILGNQENEKWHIKVYRNPLVSCIWLGVFIMVYSGIIGIFKK